MATTPSEEVTRWIKARLNEPLTGSGMINKIELHHAVEGEGSELMCVVRVGEGADPDDITQEIWNTAEEDASTRMSGRMQRYVMIARWSDDGEEPIRKPFLMNGKATMDMMSGDTEGPSPAGTMAQMMRHSEKLHTSLMQLTEMTAGRLARDLEAERKIRMRLEDERSKSIEAIQDLADRKHERDMDIKRESTKQDRHDQVMALLMGMAPLIASKFLGAGAAGAAGIAGSLPAAGARDASLHQMMKNLDEEEIMKIMQALKPSNQMVMMELFKAHKEQEEDQVAKQLEDKSDSTPPSN